MTGKCCVWESAAWISPLLPGSEQLKGENSKSDSAMTFFRDLGQKCYLHSSDGSLCAASRSLVLSCPWGGYLPREKSLEDGGLCAELTSADGCTEVVLLLQEPSRMLWCAVWSPGTSLKGSTHPPLITRSGAAPVNRHIILDCDHEREQRLQ